MRSRSWSLLAKEMTIRKAAFGAIVSRAGRGELDYACKRRKAYTYDNSSHSSRFIAEGALAVGEQQPDASHCRDRRI